MKVDFDGNLLECTISINSNSNKCLKYFKEFLNVNYKDKSGKQITKKEYLTKFWNDKNLKFN